MSRPTLHRKGASVGNSISKLGSGHLSRVEMEDEPPFEMAAGFLNFWYVPLLIYKIHVSSTTDRQRHVREPNHRPR